MKPVSKPAKISIRRYLILDVVVIALAAGALLAVILLVLRGMAEGLPLLRIGLLLFFAWSALLGLLCVSARLFMRWTIEPIDAVNEAAAEIARGDYETRIPLPKTRNEVHRLSVEINNMAEKLAFAERTKLDFISTVSHELRTPLTAIKGWSETLRSSDPPDSDLLRRGLGVIIDESMRLDSLVEELLDFSRMQSNRLVLKKEPIDILAELDEVVYFFCEQRAASDGLALHSSSPDAPAPMLGDAARIRQVFINVLDNAFKYTPQGGTITVTAEFYPEPPKDRPPAAPPELLHIIVSDTGCGVGEEDLPHITEKFFKASTGTKGSGIGLAVVEELVKAHGGSLAFVNPPGEGLSVHLSFPLKNK